MKYLLSVVLLCILFFMGCRLGIDYGDEDIISPYGTIDTIYIPTGDTIYIPTGDTLFIHDTLTVFVGDTVIIYDTTYFSLVDQFSLDFTHQVNYTTPSLIDNNLYVIIITDSWKITYGSNDWYDALYFYGYGYPIQPDTDFWYWYRINGEWPTNVFGHQDYRSDHRYKFVFIGKDEPFNFTFTDEPYSDNTGGLQVTILSIK